MNSPIKPNPDKAVVITIDERHQDQRLDNFLHVVCKGVPRSHIFRIIRSGEVRVNKGRAEAKTKLQIGDVVRVPPIKVKENQLVDAVNSPDLSRKAAVSGQSIPVLFEDEHLLVVNKPSGMAVHGGSGASFGVVESLRAHRVDIARHIELVHRLDRETSGVLVLAKKRSALRTLQEQLRARSWKKFYFALAVGHWPSGLKQVDLPLLKTQASEKEARVFVHPEGDASLTKFKVLQRFKLDSLEFSLLQAQLMTGRTHQIRVHTSANKHALAGDDRYGDFELNKRLTRLGLKRMFLHAARVQFTHPATNAPIVLEAPLAPELDTFLRSLQVLP
ncbi:MAG: RluA family pseudouridine synthase [Limnobacter sp.]|uniref:RluA family pseudouridine synthase n=1 Tax=Limnobacter sp. TaxID=2003368 RepID=UPI00391ABB26